MRRPPPFGLLRRARLALALVGLALAGPLARADGPTPPADPVLVSLIQESLAARPEIVAAEAAVTAARERARQAGAPPDPSLALGIQNDGFNGLQIGEMEQSYVSIMGETALSRPGERALRTDLADVETRLAELALSRERLTVEADVRRAYVDLLLARERLTLLAQLGELWRQSEEVARVRYETAEGSQAELMRAQLERARLTQRQWILAAEERAALATLNRLRGQPLDAPLPTPVALRDLPLPTLLEGDAAFADARARSPELAAALLRADRATDAVALARRERLPELSVSAGVMLRGPLPPMWAAGLMVPLPVYAARKQNSAVAEQQAMASGEAAGVEAVERLLAERVAERAATGAALRQVVDLYRQGLLVQSEATAESTLAGYQVGRASLGEVLEAAAGYVGDEDAYVSALASLHRVAILEAEVSLDPAPDGPGGME